MSEIKVDTLTGKTSAGDITVTSEGGAATQSLQQGLTKGWGHFEGSDGTLDDSFNMASLTDNGTGIFSPQFSNAMANVHYTCNANMDSTVVSSNQTEVSINTYATGSVKLTFRDGGSTVDKDDSVFIIHGDLA